MRCLRVLQTVAHKSSSSSVKGFPPEGFILIKPSFASIQAAGPSANPHIGGLISKLNGSVTSTSNCTAHSTLGAIMFVYDCCCHISWIYCFCCLFWDYIFLLFFCNWFWGDICCTFFVTFYMFFTFFFTISGMPWTTANCYFFTLFYIF